jgi:dihydropteroate synthase
LAVIFRARQFEFGFPRPAVVMGVVNVTPDSFSDGGKFLNAEAAVAHALKLVEQGAEILDVGGESTRPGATPVGEAEELRRVIPVIEKISAAAKVCVSIDTQKPMVARAALAAGASIVNDIAANRNDDEMWRVVADSGAGYVCMHMQGSPLTMQIEPIYADVVREVGEFFAERLCQLAAAGVTPEQVVLDAGIGFGKTVTQNVALLAAQKQFLKLGRPLLLGVSRKSFLGKISGAEVNERLPAALACTTLALADGVQFFRTHDVAETVRAVRAAEAVFSK